MNAHVQTDSGLPFNRAIFRWARERRQLSIEEAAQKIGTTPDKLDAWERGDASPTVRQARILAEAYGRAFLELFRPEVPPLQHSDLVPDFRLHRGAREPKENRELLDVQAWAEETRLNAIDLFELIGEPPPAVPKELRALLRESPEVAAGRARTAVGFPYEMQIGLRSAQRSSAPSNLRHALVGRFI